MAVLPTLGDLLHSKQQAITSLPCVTKRSVVHHHRGQIPCQARSQLSESLNTTSSRPVHTSSCASRPRRRHVLAALPQHREYSAVEVAPSLLFSDATALQVPTTEQLTEILPNLSPKQLQFAIWSFAKQGLQPAQDVLDAVALEVQSKLEHFRSPDLSNTIWALAVLKYQPSDVWWAAFERQVYQHLPDFTDRELANLLWSLAVLEHKPAWVLEPLLAAALDAFHSYSPSALHLVGWACGKLAYCPSSEWLDSYLRAAQCNFFQFTPSEMSNIIWALAKLGHKLPSLWLDHFLMVAQWRFPSFSAKTLSVVVWAVASLGHTPSQEWLVSYEQQVREKFRDFTAQELACIAWALRRFGAAPEHNAVFYMLDKQDSFLAVDFEILSNSKLLGQVRQWRQEQKDGEMRRESSSSNDGSSSSSSSTLDDGSSHWGGSDGYSM